MKLKINITKEVLKKSMWCGTEKMDISKSTFISQNCAIACAICDIFPNASVAPNHITFHICSDIELPEVAQEFIVSFDILSHAPEERLNLPEFSFEIDVPESVIEQINIDDIKNSKTLELCEN